MKNEEKRILVSGATGGIGSAIAERLAEAGYRLLLSYFTNFDGAVLLKERCLKLGAKQVSIMKFDVRDRAKLRELLIVEVETKGAFWGVVCNAGITRDLPFPALEGEDWDLVIETNLGGFFNVLNPLVMPMIQLRKGGRIVVISSISGIVGNRGQTNYAASKAGLIGASKSLAKELAKRNITVNCVAPGFIETGMTGDLKTVTDAIPMKRAGKPSEVAGVINFLISEEASYITSQVIVVDGGLT